MKKTISVVLCVLLLAFSIVPAFASGSTKYYYDGSWHSYNLPPISLIVNGQSVQSSVPPILLNNSTLVPARAVFEKMGAKVTWDSQKSQVGVALGATSVLLTINNQNAAVNGKTVKMPIPAKIINSSTMIPVRFVAESLGMNVDWESDKRIVSIAQTSQDTVISSITGSLNGSRYRVTVNADSPIQGYSKTEINDYPRLAIDIDNALFKCPSDQINLNSTYAYRVRASQYDTNPNVTRVVVDLRQWTSYTISQSSDKKQLFIDFSNDPAVVSTINITNSDMQDVINVNMSSGRQADISTTSAGKTVVTIPLATLGSVQRSLLSNGRFLKGVECQQTDATTVQLTLDTSSEASLLKIDDSSSGTTISLVSPNSTNISYTGSGYSELAIRSSVINTNYFEYRYKTEGNKFTLTMPSDAVGIGTGRMLVYDNYINYIDFKPNGSMTDIVINGKSPVDYRVNTVEDNSVLAVDVLAPNPASQPTSGLAQLNPAMRGKVVVVDPGHGGTETGAIYGQICEKDINLDIATRLWTLLKNAGVDAQMTRQGDQTVGLYERTDFAEKLNASLFISVHNNSGDPGDRGTMALFYPSPYNPAFGISSERFAQLAEQELLNRLGTANDGLWKRPGLAVLNSTDIPAIISESAYLSDSSDRQKLMTDSFRQSIAEALYNTVIRALNEIAQNTNVSIPVLNQTTDQSRNISGFIAPAVSLSKCDYSSNGIDLTVPYDFSIKLDSNKQVQGSATLDSQRMEARQVLFSQLDADTVDRVMNVLAGLKDTTSVLTSADLGNSVYSIWVDSNSGAGTAMVYIKKR
ncbi:MAG: N-acetylmuramoyl-L-alanine amidase family protein [Bacillota bacterium]|nr:N-acetylmuramoyl-L-alanine amidase family protein [Bacillota bacterium]